MRVGPGDRWAALPTAPRDGRRRKRAKRIWPSPVIKGSRRPSDCPSPSANCTVQPVGAQLSNLPHPAHLCRNRDATRSQPPPPSRDAPSPSPASNLNSPSGSDSSPAQHHYICIQIRLKSRVPSNLGNFLVLTYSKRVVTHSLATTFLHS